MEFDSNIAVLAALSWAIGYLMVLAGVHKSALEWRRRARLCASCGRALDHGVCRACEAAG
jgi:hypothetical protein